MKNTFYSQGNPYNIVRTTSATYTASVGELIIADETEITLPSGVPAGSVIAVRSSSDTVTTDVVGASGSIDGFSAGTTHQEAKTGEYVYDGSDWYLRNSVDIRDGAIPDSAVYRWQFSAGSGSTASDSIGNNDGTINGATWVSGTWQGQNALDFDGINDYISLSKVSEVGINQQFTIAATVELDTTSNQTDIWSQTDTSSGDNRVALKENGGKFVLTSFDGSTRVVNRETSTFSTGVKYRVVGVFDGSNNVGEIYVNSVKEDDADAGAAALSDIDHHEIGRDSQGEIYFDGRIDDVIIYSSLLTASEIDQDYNAQPWS